MTWNTRGDIAEDAIRQFIEGNPRPSFGAVATYTYDDTVIEMTEGAPGEVLRTLTGTLKNGDGVWGWKAKVQPDGASDIIFSVA